MRRHSFTSDSARRAPQFRQDTATGSGFPRPMKQATSTVWVPSWETTWRSQPIAKGRFHSRTAQSLLLYTTATSRRRKTTKSLAVSNLSFPALARTFSFWSRTQQSTPQLEGGVR